MKTNKSLKYFLPCLTVLAAAVSQAYAYDEEAGTELVVSGEITPKLIYFKYTGGPGDENTFFLQNYGGEQAWSGERDSGFYADFDIDLTLSNEQRDVLRLERQGFGPDNHRTRVQGGDGEIGFTGYYSNFRTNTGSIDYLLRPGTDENPVATIPPHDPTTSTSYLTMFNDDSMGASHKVERTRYGLGIKFKPDLLGKGTSLTLNIDGYDRQGTTYATWVAGGGDIAQGTALTALERFQSRWRGYDKPIDENMGRFSLNFTAAPGGMFQFAYDGSHEKFNSRARTANMVDFKAAVEGPGTDPTGLILGGTKDLHFVPDSSLTTHALRVSKTLGDTALAVGYGMSKLSQDSFSSNQIASDFNKGEINTQNAYLNLNHRLTPTTSLEGHVKYYNRDNDSTTDAPGLLDRDVEDEWGVRINNLESLTYGLSATFRALPVNSTLTAGWKREDSERDLQYNNVTGDVGAWPTVIVYSDKTESDEFYLRWTARPTQGMTLRLTPSIVSADKTAFVTEAEKSLHLKAALGYAMTAQTYMNAYYHYKKKENGNQSFIDTDKTVGTNITLGTEYPQKADDTFHAAGLTFNHNPSEWVGLSASLNWAQNDFETYFFGTDRRRFEPALIVFDQRGISAFTADTWSLTLNADYQPSDRLKLRAGYMLSTTEGDLTTTTTALADVVSDKIDHTLHSVALGADYQLRNNWVLKGSYVYDRFTDKTYPVLDGNHHSVMLGAGLRF